MCAGVRVGAHTRTRKHAGFVVRDPDGKAELQRIIVGAEERTSKDGTPYTLVRYLTPDGQPPGSLPTVTPTMCPTECSSE